MKINLLDKTSNVNIILAGIISIIISLGVARFAFTSLLPPMLEDSLTVTFAGILASVNFAGYLSGSLLSMFIKDMYTKVKLFRLGMIFAVLSTVVLATTTNETIWVVARIAAGISAALGFVVGAAIVMSKLKFDDKTKAMGIHFSGIGFSIVTTDIIVRIVNYYQGSWQDAWMILSIFGAIILIYPFYILSVPKTTNNTNVKMQLNKAMFTPFVIVLIAAYFTEGIGFVVQATFLPDIINSLEGLEGLGGITWLIVGISGIFSCIIWMRLAAKYGYINIIMITMTLQAIGILIPALTNNAFLNILSGVFYGGTFVGLVALFMSLGGKLAGDSPVILMGAITTSYGLGQVVAPLYSVVLIEYSGNYNYALFTTAFIVMFGVFMLAMAKKILKVNY